MNNSKKISPEEIKKIIIKRFNENVKGKIADTSAANVAHDGREGHWLEAQMGVDPNASNTPDIMGYEMKNETTSKTTFGDWSASEYIYKKREYGINRDRFMEIFGSNPNGRFSWSGKPVPKIGAFNECGQILVVDANNNIEAIYSVSRDRRLNKAQIVPSSMQKENLVIAKWSAIDMKKKVEDKFNNMGWFKCKKNSDGVYSEIVFGGPINFESWIKGVKNGSIYFDSGMYQGNSRNYSQWRADNNYWDSLVIDTYK